jgi:hypothetical protein
LILAAMMMFAACARREPRPIELQSEREQDEQDWQSVMDRWPEKRQALFDELKSYQNREIGKLPKVEQERVQVLLDSLVLNDREKGQPLLFLEFTARDQPQFWVAIGHDRSEEELIGTVFEPSGRLVSTYGLRLGAGASLSALRVQTPGSAGYPLLVADVYSSDRKEQVFRYYFAWLHNRFDVIRLERDDGKPMRNDYRELDAVGSNNGPVFSDEEWEAALNSPDRSTVLRVLVWLGGIRPEQLASGLEPTQFDSNSIEDAKQVRRLLSKPAVLNSLKELSGQDDRWIRDAADVVLASLPDR